MKILHIINTLSAGGAETHLLTLGKLLQARGAEIIVACLREHVRTARSLRNDFEEVGIRVIRLQADGRYDLRSFSKVAALVGNEQPSILHTHLPRADLAGVVARMGHRQIPWVCSIHNIHDKSWSGRWTLPVFKFVWSRADRVIAISHAVKDWLVSEGFTPAERINVVHYGIDPERFSQPTVDLKAAFGVEGKPVVGTIGRLERRKGHECLIHAMCEIRKSVPHAQLLIAGHDPEGYGHELRALIDSLGLTKAVHLLGFQSDIPSFLGVLDVFAFSTLAEGFGQVVIEAMAAGKPVVVSHIPPLTEIVAHEETGLLVDPEKPYDFAAAICRLLTQRGEAKKMGVRGRERVFNYFCAERMAAETLSVYKRLIEAKHGSANNPYVSQDMEVRP